METTGLTHDQEVEYENLPGALHFFSANCLNRAHTFRADCNCSLFLDAVKKIKEDRPFKLVAHVVMPDHCHLIVNPRDGRITDLTCVLKGLSARWLERTQMRLWAGRPAGRPASQYLPAPNIVAPCQLIASDLLLLT